MGVENLNPNRLFRVEAADPPAHIRTIEQFKVWQAQEHERMLSEAARLFREQLDACFAQFARDVHDETQH